MLTHCSSLSLNCAFQTQPAVHVQGQEPLTASMLAAAPPQEQKQMLGKTDRYKQMMFRVLVFGQIYTHSQFFFLRRGASVPTDSGHACQPSRKDHWHVAGDRQLWITTHAWVPWVSTFKGTSLPQAHWIVWYPFSKLRHAHVCVCTGRRSCCSSTGSPGEERRHPESRWHGSYCCCCHILKTLSYSNLVWKSMFSQANQSGSLGYNKDCAALMGRHCVVSEHRKLRGDGKRRTTLESPVFWTIARKQKSRKKRKTLF